MSLSGVSPIKVVAGSVVCLVVLGWVPAAEAQPRDDAFKAGLDARDGKRWEETAQHMRTAIQADPKENDRKVRRGIRGLLGTGNEYLPYYYLGEALYNLGDCAGAVDAWSTSEQQRVVQARRDYVALIQKGYTACELTGVLPPAKYGPLVGRTRQLVMDVTALARSVSSAADNHIDLWRPDIREQYDRASGELQNAGAQLVTATRTRTERDFAGATASAERARNILKGIEAQLRAGIEGKETAGALAAEIENILRDAEVQDRALDTKRSILKASPALVNVRRTAAEAIGRVRAQLAVPATKTNVAALTELRASALDAVNKLKSTADELTQLEKDLLARRFTEVLATAEQSTILVADGFAMIEQRAAKNPVLLTREMTAERAAIQEAASRLQRRLETARRTQNLAGLEETTRAAVELRARLNALIGMFGPMTLVERGIPAALVEGARLFFSGGYKQAVAMLDLAQLKQVPHQPHVHLFRAAALHALWVQSGEKEASLRTDALREIERCKELNPRFLPDERAFGPRFVSFFQAVLPSAPASSQQ